MSRLVFDFPAEPGPDGHHPTARGARTVFSDPVETISAVDLEEVMPAIERVRDAADAGLHAAGFLAYEAAPALDPAMRVRPAEPADPTGRTDRLPLLWFGLYRAPDARTPDPRTPEPEPRPAPSPDLDWAIETDRAAHAAAVASIREAIAEGRTYQVNLTTRMRAPFTGDPWPLYERMRRAQGAGYHAFLDLGRLVILSASPELFFRTRGRAVATRPMKGTRPRGRWPEEDRALAAELRRSGKDRAESLMITDLLRNDLGRVCEPGTVRVSALHDVERYRTVWQMTSTVEGRLRDDVRLPGLLAALFPCGSVTGAPKISTMAEIARLETSPREVYCGAIGWVRPGGDATFSVPIRTAWLDRETGRLAYGTGGGVVWDSTPDGEYDELRSKAVVIREPWPELALLETLRLAEGRYTRLERHLQRIRDSADYFDFPDPATPVRTALQDLARRRPAGSFLARITFHADGTARAEATPLDQPGAPTPAEHTTPPATVVLARTPVDSGDRFLFHKTTHRRVHDTRRAEAGDEAFDVLLHNERGELTEFTRGNLVVELDSRRLTPPLSAGLLAGCLRQELLDDRAIAEATLYPADLDRADRVWFINSARGWIEVRVSERPGSRPPAPGTRRPAGPASPGRGRARRP